ncbi:hypothetical protein MG293_007684 [Ovis ammon polii]|uniref:Uncharacterized protein n=1 Tax=Ovis ammon polii TaxID=230172 RepID=A0AAD4Y8V6_OVIAM|nr:hypothetical protein MG293_007684 [Ovis ammon polii]
MSQSIQLPLGGNVEDAYRVHRTVFGVEEKVKVQKVEVKENMKLAAVENLYNERHCREEQERKMSDSGDPPVYSGGSGTLFVPGCNSTLARSGTFPYLAAPLRQHVIAMARLERESPVEGFIDQSDIYILWELLAVPTLPKPWFQCRREKKKLVQIKVQVGI